MGGCRAQHQQKPVNGAHPRAVVVAVLAQEASQGPSRNVHTGIYGIQLTFSARRNHICFLRVLGQDGQVRHVSQKRKVRSEG